MSYFVIASNVLKRLLKKPIVIMFIVFFPIMAAVFGKIVYSPPTATTLGIVNNEYGESLYNDMKDLKEYNIELLNDDIAENQLKNSSISILLNYSGNKVQLKAISENDTVTSLKNQLLYYHEHGNFYTTFSEPNKYPMTAIGIFMLFIVMSIGICSTIILDDRQDKTYMRLFCYKTTAFKIAANYLIAIIIVGILQVFIFSTLITIMLNIGLNSIYLTIMFTLIMFVIATVGLVIAVGSMFPKKENFNGVLPVVAIFSTFLSGSIVPVKSFGKAFVYVSYLFPHSYVINFFNALENGESFVNSLPYLLTLLLFGIVFTSFGSKLINKETL